MRSLSANTLRLDQDPILPNETVIYIRGALHTPTNDVALIGCNQTFVTCPGKPTNGGYQDGVFDMPDLYVYAIGQVTSHADLMDIGVVMFFKYCSK